MNVFLKLNDGIGISLGPNFAIKANIGLVTPNTLTKDVLLAGTLVSVNDLATTITIESTGSCTNSLTLNIDTPTTTTTTIAPTTTTTVAPTTSTTTVLPTTSTTLAPTTSTTLAPTTSTTAAPTTSTTTVLPTTSTTLAPTTSTTLAPTTSTTAAPTTSTTTLIPTTSTTLAPTTSTTLAPTTSTTAAPTTSTTTLVPTTSTTLAPTTTTTAAPTTSTTLAPTTTTTLAPTTSTTLAPTTSTTTVAPTTSTTLAPTTSTTLAPTTTTTAAPTTSTTTLVPTTSTTTAAPTTTTTTLVPTTTTTQAPVTFDMTYTCTGTTQTITISNFAGGNGTYYANTTTYVDAAAASAGSTSLVAGTSLSYTNQPSSFGVSTRYVKVVSGTQSLIKSAGFCCDTAANWVYQNNTTCVSCANLPVYRDTNQCSPTYNYYKIDTGGTPQLTQPSYGACDTAANYSYVVGNYYTCSNGSVITTPVYQNTNPCFTGNQYKVNSTTYTANPSNSYPNTAANWVNNGAAYCSSNCVAYQPQIDNNPCSPTYGTTRDYYIGSASPCVYSANYSSVVGTLYVCNVSGGGVNSYTVYQNTNSCFTGNQWYATNGSTYASNPSNSYPDTTQNWQQNGANYCSGVDLYQPQIQTNPCAVNYNGTRDYLIEANSNTCAEVYVLSDCLSGGTGFSIVYSKNTFAVNDRVTSGGVTYVITSVTTTGSAGSYALSSTGQTGCPQYTQFTDLCTSASYYISGTGLSGIGTSSDVPGDCLQVTGTTSSPTGTQIYNWTSDPGCECV